MSAPDVVTVHISYTVVFRHTRRAFLRLFCLGVALAAIITVLLVLLTHSNRVASADHASSVWPLLADLAYLLAISYIFWLGRRFGYYARPGELGMVGVFGRLTPFRQPVVRFHRFTMTNRPWLRFLGLGSLLNTPVIVAVTETGQRALLLSLILYPQADVDRLLAASGLPVEGDWSERVGRFSIRKRWPGSGDTRRQGWIAVPLLLPVLLVYGGALAAALLVH